MKKRIFSTTTQIIGPTILINEVKRRRFNMENTKLDPKSINLQTRLDNLNSLRDIFYEMPGCSCGGALHILLDDGNIRDTDIVFCYKELHKEKYSSQRAVGLAILHELIMLSEAHRKQWWGYEEVK